MTRAAALLLLLLLAGLLFFLGLGSLHLTDRDEGSNAEAAREMLETGDWITPTFNYEPRFAKPALLYWVTSAGYRWFGVNEATARLPSAVFGVLLILLQFAFLAHERRARLAVFGALMLLVNVEIVAIGRMALTDSVLMFWTTLALYGFWTGLHGTGGWRHAMWALYVGMALGTLTKGPIGVLVPLLAVVPYLFLTRRWPEFWRHGHPIAGAMLFAVIALPWYAAMLWIHGERYIASAQADTVGRFRTTIGGHGGTVFFYLPILLLGFFPWSVFLPGALREVWRTWREARLSRDAPPAGPPAAHELELFAALWLVAGFLFFSVSATRLPHYIAPLFPAAALLAAAYWSRVEAAGSRWPIRTLMIVGYLLGLLLAVSPMLYDAFVNTIAKEFPMAPQVHPGARLVVIGALLVLGMGAVGFATLTDRRRTFVVWIVASTMVVALVTAMVTVIPWFSEEFLAPPHKLAYYAANLGPGDRFIYYGPPRPSVVFYARRKVIMIKPGQEEELAAHLAQPGRTIILMPSRLKSQLPAAARAFIPLDKDRGGYTVLADRPFFELPPDLPPPPRGLGPHG